MRGSRVGASEGWEARGDAPPSPDQARSAFLPTSGPAKCVYAPLLQGRCGQWGGGRLWLARGGHKREGRRHADPQSPSAAFFPTARPRRALCTARHHLHTPAFTPFQSVRGVGPGGEQAGGRLAAHASLTKKTPPLFLLLTRSTWPVPSCTTSLYSLVEEGKQSSKVGFCLKRRSSAWGGEGRRGGAGVGMPRW